jgi:predicted permease
MLKPIIFAIIEIFGIFGIGALARRLGHIKQDDLNSWARLIIDFLFPMLVFSSIYKNFNPNRLSELWLLPLIGFGLMFFGALLGYALKYGIKNKTRDRLNTFHHFCAINNYGFLPIIIITNLWGEKYLPLLFFLNIGSSIGYWTIGVGLLGGRNIKSTLKNVISPNLIAIILALLVSLCGLKAYIPEMLVTICSKLGAAAIPLMLLLIGASLYGSSQVFKNKYDIAYLSLARLIVIPFLSILLLKLLPLPQDAYRIAYVVAIMPVSVSSTIMTRRYGGDPDFAGQAALLTTIASIASIPAMLYFIDINFW